MAMVSRVTDSVSCATQKPEPVAQTHISCLPASNGGHTSIHTYMFYTRSATDYWLRSGHYFRVSVQLKRSQSINIMYGSVPHSRYRMNHDDDVISWVDILGSVLYNWRLGALALVVMLPQCGAELELVIVWSAITNGI